MPRFRKVIVFFIVFLLLTLFTVSYLFVKRPFDVVTLPSKFVLKLDMDQIPRHPVDFYRMLRDLHRAADDERVDGVSFVVNDYDGSMHDAWELRNAVLKLRDSGKFVNFYCRNFTINNAQYYSLSAASAVIMHSWCVFNLKGDGVIFWFFKNVLARYAIKCADPYAGKYKVFGSFDSDSLDSDYKKMFVEFLDSMTLCMCSDIAKSRGVSVDYVMESMAKGPFLAEEALSYGFIDKVSNDFESSLKGSANSPIIPFTFYQRCITELRKNTENKYIALFLIDTQAFDGDLLSRFLDKMKAVEKDSTIQVVVIHCNVRGGRSINGDIIRMAIKRLDDVKPVILVGGNNLLSASYFAALGASHILSGFFSKVGSIGVASERPIFNIKDALRRIGIDIELISKNDNAFFGTSFCDIDSTLDFSKRHCELIYNDMLNEISRVRGIDIDMVKKICDGRVFIGEVAVSNGLIDKIGGIVDSMKMAKDIAGGDYRVSLYPFVGKYTGKRHFASDSPVSAMDIGRGLHTSQSNYNVNAYGIPIPVLDFLKNIHVSSVASPLQHAGINAILNVLCERQVSIIMI